MYPSPAYDVRLVDATGDGVIDVVVATDEGVVVLPQDASGGLGEPRVWSTPAPAVKLLAAPLAIEPSDIDHDELVVACPESDSIVVLLNEPDAGIIETAEFPVGDGPVDLALGQLGGDGFWDFLTADRLGSSATVLYGDGDGSFSRGGSIPLPTAPIAIHFVVGTNITLAVVGEDGDTVWMVEADRDTLSVVSETPYSVPSGSIDVSIGSFSDAGPTRVQVVSEGAELITRYNPWDWGVSEQVSHPGGPAALGFTGDYVNYGIDVWGVMLVALRSADAVAVSPYNNLTTMPLEPAVFAVGTGAAPNAVAGGDVNGDGLDDIVTASVESGVTLLLGRP